MKYKLHKQYRLQTHDYASIGSYFITICCKNGQYIFGDIPSITMKLNDIGEVAKKNLLKIEETFKTIKIDCWVIMPNHLHMILLITEREQNTKIESEPNTMNRVPTEIGSLSSHNPMLNEQLTVGKVIRWFKAKSTFQIRKELQFEGKVWQSRFHDRVIRNDAEYWKIKNYINSNERNWYKDMYFKKVGT